MVDFGGWFGGNVAQVKGPCEACEAPTEVFRAIDAPKGMRLLCEACKRAAEEAELEADRLRQWLEVIPVTKRSAQFGVNAHERIKSNPEDIGRIKGAATALRNITIAGMPGSGKTSLAAALVRWIYPRHTLRVEWFSAQKLVRAQAGHPLGHGDPREVSEATRAGLLILDDLGNEPTHALSPISPILFAREESGLPTWIISTLLDKKAVADRYDGGVARRAFELADLIVLGQRKAS